MANYGDPNPRHSSVIADGWEEFAKTVLPTVGGTDQAEAHIAFHFGAMYALQIVKQVVAQKVG